MATFLLNRGRINLAKNDIKPLFFYQIHFVWQIDMKYEISDMI